LLEKLPPEERSDVQGWPGHRSIASTTIYTALASNRFRVFWRE
jgi:site-specific recombinase XerD